LPDPHFLNLAQNHFFASFNLLLFEAQERKKERKNSLLVKTFEPAEIGSLEPNPRSRRARIRSQCPM
jgi:hypothetical protein